MGAAGRRSGALLIGTAVFVACTGGAATDTSVLPEPTAATTSTEAPAPTVTSSMSSTTTTTTTTTTTIAYPATTTTTTLPFETGLGITLFGEAAYASAVPLYLHERVGDASVSGRTRENVVIGVAMLVPPDVEIRTPLDGLLTTWELYEGDPDYSSLTRKQALLKTNVFNSAGDRLILRWGTTYGAFRFTNGAYSTDRPVAAGDAIGAARCCDAPLIDWPRWRPGEELRVYPWDFNLLFWAEWGSRSEAGEQVMEWFPHLMGIAASSEHLHDRSYATFSDHSVSVFNAQSPTWRLRPAILWLPDTGDPPDTAASLIAGADTAPVFAASWSGFDPHTGEGFEDARLEVACLLRFIRSEGIRYGADPERVTVAGHGAGGVMAVAAAADPDAFASTPPEACDYWDDLAAVTGAVAVGGVFDRPDDPAVAPAGFAAVFQPAPVTRTDARWFGFVLSDDDVEADPYAITATAEALTGAGHETEVVRAQATHDQLLNADHGQQGWPAVRLLVSATRWGSIAERFWTAVGEDDTATALRELAPDAGPVWENRVGFLAALGFEFVPFSLPADGGEFEIGMVGRDRCVPVEPDAVVCEYRILNADLMEVFERATGLADDAGIVEVILSGSITEFTYPQQADAASALAAHAAAAAPDGFAEHCSAQAYDSDQVLVSDGFAHTEACARFLIEMISDFLES